MAGEGGRAELAAEQTRLVRALAAGGPVPEGFDPARLNRAALALLHKRRRSLARVWPGLAGALGERFASVFATYAESTPLPPGGAGEDGRAFAEWLDRTRQLPEAARLDLLLARCRDGRPVRAASLRNPPRLAVAIRLPWLGVRWMVFRVG